MYITTNETTNSEIEIIFHQVLFVFLIIFLCLAIPYVIISCMFRNSNSTHVFLIFQRRTNRKADLTRPTKYRLCGATSFFLPSDQGIILGVWHVRPYGVCRGCAAATLCENSRVAIYAHGNSGTRAGANRVGIYRKLCHQFNFHVVAFDYRGFADSTDVKPTVSGVVSDLRHIYQWVIKQGVKQKNIILWAHSLGTGIASQFLNDQNPNDFPAGTVLESPFTSLSDIIKMSPMAKLLNCLPWFEFFFIDPIVNNRELNLNTVATLKNIHCPLLILHAEDDVLVPFELGKSLYEQAVKLQPSHVKPRPQFVAFDKSQHLGHSRIHKSPKLVEIIKQFLNSIQFDLGEIQSTSSSNASFQSESSLSDSFYSPK